MRVLLDECVDVRLCASFRERGVDALHVKDTSWRGLSNSALYREACSACDLFVTTDRHFRHPAKYPATATMGIIFLRVTPTLYRYLAAAMTHLLDQVSLDALIGKHVVVRREDFTIR